MKFYHLADIHLGAEPDRDCSYGKQRAKEIWETFRRVIDKAKKERPDCIFISGDLFHRQPLLKEVREVDYLFSQIPDTVVFLTAGNHDYYNRKSAYAGFTWSANVRFIDAGEVAAVHEEKLNLTVYGHSYYEKEIRSPLYDDLKPESGDGIHVLMAHGGDMSHVPMNYRKIGHAGFHYVAMGHIHKPGIHKDFDMAYAGSLEPLEVNETGNHGYIEGVIHQEKFSGAYRTEVRFVPAASRAYVHLKIELQEHMSDFELEDTVLSSMKEAGEQNLFKIILTGARRLKWMPDIERIRRLGNVSVVEDRSRVSYDIEKLKEQYKGQLIGAYLESFDDGVLTEQEERIRKLGLEALLAAAGGKI